MWRAPAWQTIHCQRCGREIESILTPADVRPTFALTSFAETHARRYRHWPSETVAVEEEAG